MHFICDEKYLSQIDIPRVQQIIKEFKEATRIKDKELALELTKLAFQYEREAYSNPLSVFKEYWRELATMV